MCGSQKVGMVAGGSVGIYECENCKFKGALFPEIDSKKEGKDKMKKIRQIKFCPKCKSENIIITTKFVKSPARFLAPHLGMNKCHDCGFEAPTFPIKVKEEIKKENGR